MAAYISVQSLESRVPVDVQAQLAGEAGAAWGDPAVQALLAQAIADAQGEVDGYVGIAHSVPMSDPPSLVCQLTADLAVYHLYRRRGEVPEAWEKTRSRVLRTCELIATGKISLGAPATGQAEPTGGEILVSAPGPIFGADFLGKYYGGRS